MVLLVSDKVGSQGLRMWDEHTSRIPTFFYCTPCQLLLTFFVWELEEHSCFQYEKANTFSCAGCIGGDVPAVVYEDADVCRRLSETDLQWQRELLRVLQRQEVIFRKTKYRPSCKKDLQRYILQNTQLQKKRKVGCQSNRLFFLKEVGVTE